MKYYATKISDNMHETPEGYLLCLNVPIGRVGEMEYGKGETPIDPVNGTTKISRTEEEIFRPETIASFEGKPFTIKHPEEFVSPDNWKDLAKGIMQNVRRGDGEMKDDLVADILITDAFAISLVKNGLRGLSCGYEAEYEQTGEGKGIQKNIVGNHLALVDEGRAGDAYAITDSKGDRMTKTLAEKMKGMFAKVIDEAVAKDEPKEEPKKDESKDAGAYDELVKICKDLAGKIDAMKPKDEEKKDDVNTEKKDEGKDDETSGLEERIKALEAAVAKLLEGETEEAGDEDEEETETDDEGEEEESEDDAELVATGDTAARAEILAPGLKASKDIKAKALKKAYDTEDGKKVIDSLTGGKPTFDSAEKVDTLFIAASELLKVKRAGDLSKTKMKTNDFDSHIFSGEGAMTPEKMNELNAKRYNAK